MLSKVLEGIISRKWNSERFTVYSMVALQGAPDVSRARVKQRLDLWDKEEHQLLTEECLRCLQAGVSKAQGTTTPEQGAKTFHRMVLKGNL